VYKISGIITIILLVFKGCSETISPALQLRALQVTLKKEYTGEMELQLENMVLREGPYMAEYLESILVAGHV
jgi:hypothetical protein